mmetsp:Transcript_144476/g.448575  ORF Transcript_144476/g.448575 Transcript_144476/m.448575 type:complete len:296 (-) Transcript_144476:60-947(-)
MHPAGAAGGGCEAAEDRPRGQGAHPDHCVHGGRHPGAGAHLLLGVLRQQRRRRKVSRHAEQHVQPPAQVAQIPARRKHGPRRRALGRTAGPPAVRADAGQGGRGSRHPEGRRRGAQRGGRGNAADAEGPSPPKSQDAIGVDRREGDGAEAGATRSNPHSQRTAFLDPRVERSEAGQVARAEAASHQGHREVQECQAVHGGGQEVSAEDEDAARRHDGAVPQVPRDEEAGRHGPEKLQRGHHALDGGRRVHRGAEVGLEGRQEDAERVDRPEGENVDHECGQHQRDVEGRPPARHP